MAYAITSAAVVKLVDNVLSAREVTVKNDGTGSVVISKDPQITATGAHAFIVPASSEQDVTLEVGEALYAITAAGASASVEVV